MGRNGLIVAILFFAVDCIFARKAIFSSEGKDETRWEKELS